MNTFLFFGVSTQTTGGCISDDDSADVNKAVLDYVLHETDMNIHQVLQTLEQEKTALSSSSVDYSNYLSSSDLSSARATHQELLGCVNQFNYYLSGLNEQLRSM
eukprot:TRINITY_DN220_c0_g1_i2.p1 TRINITY_DN220_c0_g1~~TRINITY_DN220_c0_g1_i2.p1  ORF type:complete len:104 (-),score=22.84 TRINITY_DN220_c0_g1_i2:86-397(-)